ncbi:hypothetical protein AV530_002327 [Patagioenas fasciata monilis]|uniref:Uncharacterized protein n=1 Tax=Patagioenas fasciata monilis TaxID=372326 RepID=A0A1V4K7J7_PATFA|nr:hypothetical protein AV530_002327 [Patagioenas fasciata monilis]
MLHSGVWAAEDMAKEEGMVVGDQLPNRRVSLGEFKGAAGRHRGNLPLTMAKEPAQLGGCSSDICRGHLTKCLETGVPPVQANGEGK